MKIIEKSVNIALIINLVYSFVNFGINQVGVSVIYCITSFICLIGYMTYLYFLSINTLPKHNELKSLRKLMGNQSTMYTDLKGRVDKLNISGSFAQSIRG